MQQNPNDLIIEVLNIIGYTDDKQKFANDFIDSCRKQTFLELLSNLPSEEQQALNQQLESGEDSKTSLLLNEQFSREEYNQALKKVIEGAFKEYLETIKPHLSKDQLQELQVFFSR